MKSQTNLILLAVSAAVVVGTLEQRAGVAQLATLDDALGQSSNQIHDDHNHDHQHLTPLLNATAPLPTLQHVSSAWAASDFTRSEHHEVPPQSHDSLGVPAVSPLLVTQQQQQLDRAVAALRDAQDAPAKAAAKKGLDALLNRWFDEDMRRREQQLAKVEERVHNLRVQLDRRSEKREEIVSLQLKVLENEAAGLGFFTRSADANSQVPTTSLVPEQSSWQPQPMRRPWPLEPPSGGIPPTAPIPSAALPSPAPRVPDSDFQLLDPHTPPEP